MQDSSELAHVWEMGMRGCYCEKDALQSAGEAGICGPLYKTVCILPSPKQSQSPTALLGFHGARL